MIWFKRFGQSYPISYLYYWHYDGRVCQLVRYLVTVLSYMASVEMDMKILNLTLVTIRYSKLEMIWRSVEFSRWEVFEVRGCWGPTVELLHLSIAHLDPLLLGSANLRSIFSPNRIKIFWSVEDAVLWVFKKTIFVTISEASHFWMLDGFGSSVSSFFSAGVTSLTASSFSES